MVIEISNGILTLIVLLGFLTFLVAPDIAIFGIVIIFITIIALGMSKKSITIKTEKSVIIRMNSRIHTEENLSKGLK